MLVLQQMTYSGQSLLGEEALLLARAAHLTAPGLRILTVDAAVTPSAQRLCRLCILVYHSLRHSLTGSNSAIHSAEDAQSENTQHQTHYD